MAAHSLAHFSLRDVRVPACMMEITTVIGCNVNCTYCPQKSLLGRYRSPKRKLAFADFRLALDKMPDDVTIIFAGFSEPFLNEECARMILHAHHKGHPLCVFTTAVGMSLQDVDQIKDIPFSAYPHGGFTIHLPDARGLAKIDVTPEYLQVLEALKAASIQNFSVMSMGAIHPDVESIFPQSSVALPTMNSRSGNLEKQGVSESFQAASHDGPVICGRDEYIYNNVMLPNGDIVLCCQDYHLDHVLGNIFEQSFSDLLPSPLHSYDLCKTCVYAIKLPQNFPVFEFAKAPA
ncbi:radical SAM/SPASM domain-containing protein [Cyanobium sp. Morenito 9A2]|uniref:radical SAM/SPASM domain-containing protein n=1 Tax=Cyanobium sp. Morenito 9A2 TaxID=2823718 RepID=UPI0020CC120C|nr:radical SAM/SPASM domain-containing protein [Cyanobium sp. Morenito 9A2]MCP9849822.1 radical SAM protein [Cyanobium sp. Morenito 9A2]